MAGFLALELNVFVCSWFDSDRVKVYKVYAKKEGTQYCAILTEQACQ